MVKFCPQCGIKLDKDYAFCPNCGYELVQVRKELNKNNSFVSKPKEIKKEKTPSAPVFQNNLSNKRLFYFMGGLFLLVVIILFSSGLFDSPVGKEMMQAPVENNQAPGVDLSMVNEIKTLEDKVSANPEDSKALLQLANLKHDSGMFESAIANYKKYLETNPSNADARVDMGVCYYSLKNYNEAIIEMKKAVQYNPKHQLGYINLGIVTMSAGSLDEAKKFWQKAVDLDPGLKQWLESKRIIRIT